METQTVVAILNEVLAIEQCSLAMRLGEATMFVSPHCVEDLKIARQMAQAGEEHGAWLSDAILQLGGTPGLSNMEAASADLHFQELRRVRPRLIADRESLIAKYALAAERVGAEPDAAAPISRILERHRDELAQLTQLADPPEAESTS